jgi:hypothetical protein
LDKLEEVRVSEVWFEHINLSSKIRSRLYDFLNKKSPDLIPYFNKASAKEYREKLDKIIYSLMKERKIRIGMEKVIHHKKV